MKRRIGVVAFLCPCFLAGAAHPWAQGDPSIVKSLTETPNQTEQTVPINPDFTAINAF